MRLRKEISILAELGEDKMFFYVFGVEIRVVDWVCFKAGPAIVYFWSG